MSRAAPGAGLGHRLNVPLEVVAIAQETCVALREIVRHAPLKWSWSCRALPCSLDNRVIPVSPEAPRAGDVILVQVDKVQFHQRIMTAAHERLRIYSGDTLIGVFGNRYATDAYEAEVRTTDDLSLLTGAGLIGTVLSQHCSMKPATSLHFLGYLADQQQQRINLKTRLFSPAAVNVSNGKQTDNVILVVGSGMNSGKTTAAAKLVKGLLRRGVKVSACKLTGSVCERDLNELRATGAAEVRDFSDYGFPSTYLSPPDELRALCQRMLSDVSQTQPQLIVAEIADGLLQRETKFILHDPLLKPRVRGVVLAAGCASSAIFGARLLEEQGHIVMAMTGRLTNSPLFLREATELTQVPVGSSADSGDSLADCVLRQCRPRP